MTILAQSDFESDSVGSLPAGWTAVVGTWAIGTIEPATGSKTLVNTSNVFKDLIRYTGVSASADQVFSIITRAITQNYNSFGVMARLNPSGKSGYAVSLEYGETAGEYTIQISKQDDTGAISLISSRIIISGSITTGSYYNVEIKAIGSTIEGRFWPSGGSRPATASVSVVDTTYTSGLPGLLRINALAGGNDGSNRSIDSFVISDTTVASTIVLFDGPTSGASGSPSSSFTVSTDGSVSSNFVVTMSDGGAGGTFTPATVTLTSASPTKTFTYTPSSGGTKTISVTNNAGLANDTPMSYSAIANSLTDSHVFYSPYNWDFVSGKKSTTCAGAYIKFSVTGTTSVALTFDNSGGGNSTIRWQINGGSWANTQTLTGASPVVTISGITSGATTELKIVIDSVGLTDRWTGPSSAAILTNINVGSGTLLNPTLKSKRSLYYGDSITEGQNTQAGNINSAVDSSVRLLMDLLDSEYGAVGYGFQGYVHTGTGNVPGFNTSYSSFSNGRG